MKRELSFCFLIAGCALRAQSPLPNPAQFVAWPEQTGFVDRIAIQSQPQRVWLAGKGLYRSMVAPSLLAMVEDRNNKSFQTVHLPGVPSAETEVADISFSADGKLGWAMMRYGTIFRSLDGGDTWRPANVEAEEAKVAGEFRRLRFAPDSRTGVLIATGGLWLTQDGGEHWRRTNSQNAWMDVAVMPGGKNVWVVGSSGWITRSADGGQTWSQVSHHNFVPLIAGLSQSLYRIVFESSGRRGWIGGEGGTFLYTTSGGRSWRRAHVVKEARDLDIVDIAFDGTSTHGWAIGRGGRDGGRVLRSVDGGESWDVTDALPGNYFRIAVSENGTKLWAAGGGLLESFKNTQAPVIKEFKVEGPDLIPEVSAVDPDSPQEQLRYAVKVQGPGFAQQPWFAFGGETGALEWPPNAFVEGQKYRLLLRVSDGWNVAEKRLEFIAGREAEKPASPPPSARIATPELDGLNLPRASVRLDGVVVDTAEILSRGGDGKVAIQTGSTVQKLKDGFHSLTVSDAATGAVRQIGFYKELMTLKLFRPYRRSYALLIAVGDYPSTSGYGKLPSAVPQARKLEAVLRAQGFVILPPLYDHQATKEKIEAAIRSTGAGPEDRLLVYFGGHGDDQKGFQGKPVGYLAPYDVKKNDLWGTAIPLEKLTTEYATRLPAKHVLFALDSCQSGLATVRGGGADERSEEELRRFKALADVEAMTSEPGRTILSAGTGGQDALDVSGGIFTAALIDGIDGKADLDSNGVVDYHELLAFVWGRVNREARSWVRRQQPTDYHLGGGRWVFIHDRRVLP